MPRWPSSLRSRLTLWYTVLLSLPLIAFAFASYLVLARTLERRTDRFIGDALTAFSRELAAERRAALTVVQAMRSTADEVHFRDLHVAILDSTGVVVAVGTGGPGSEFEDRHSDVPRADFIAPRALRGRAITEVVAFSVHSDRGAYRVLARPLVVGGQRFSLTGAYSLHDVEAVLERIRGMYLVAIPLLLLAAAVGGYLLAKTSLTPLALMAAQAAEISVTNLHERLPVSGSDELVRLARVMNGLLDRLDHSFATQRRFASDASHELRTPTAIVRTEADVTLSREHRTEEEYRASIAIMQDAARRLTRIVDDLFLLSRADSGQLVAGEAELYLEELVHDTTHVVRSMADQRGVHVEVRRLVEAPFRGDADLLGRLLLNLLDNAIKYSPEGGTVDVVMARGNDYYDITVADGGPGIPLDARERVFERFFRVDAARSRTHTTATSGAGLGLAIARRIAEMHGGRLEIVDARAGRTAFRLRLPVSRIEAADQGAGSSA